MPLQQRLPTRNNRPLEKDTARYRTLPDYVPYLQLLCYLRYETYPATTPDALFA